MALKITFDFGCGPDCIYPAALCSDEDIYLVDCGYAGFLPLIEDAMRGAGLEPGALPALSSPITTTTTWARWPH